MADENTRLHPFDATTLPVVELHGPHKSIKMRGAHEKDHIFATMAASAQFYEQGLLDYLSAIVAPGGLVVDVGANIGTHTMWFASQHSCTVRAFEAVPETVRILCANVQLNGFDGQVRIEPVAVGRCAGRVAIAQWNPENTGATQLQRASAEDRVSISMVRLDDLEWDAPVTLLKIDVEGMELEVLAGAENLVDRDRPVLVAEAQDDAAEASLRAWFGERGYTVLARMNATPTLVAAPSTGADVPGAPEMVARSLEHLMTRFDEFDSRLDRFGRYLHSLRQAETESGSPSDPGSAPSSRELNGLRRKVKELEGELRVAKLRERAAHDLTPEDQK